MEQLAGGATAFQFKLIELEEDEVAVSPAGASGSVLQLLDVLLISIPLDLGWSADPAV